MNQDEHAEGQGQPAEERPAPASSGETQPTGSDLRPPGPRRPPRFRRGGRGRGRRGGGGGGREPALERAPSSAPPEGRPAPRPLGTVRDAIEQVAQIQADLEKVLDDFNEIIRTLDQAEREKTASEREIEVLRESLRRLRGDRGDRADRSYSRPPRDYSAERPSSQGGSHEESALSEPMTEREESTAPAEPSEPEESPEPREPEAPEEEDTEEDKD